MVDRKLLRLSAILLIAGEVVYQVAEQFHPEGGITANVVFTSYANSPSWTLVHETQFVGSTMVIFGMLALFSALGVTSGIRGVVLRFAAASAVAVLALNGTLYAVDGIALKQAVDAWMSAPAAEQATRFASAEAIRWLEWGIASYQTYMLGLSLVLFAIVIVWTARVPRPIGYLKGLSGLAFIILGWVVGTEGFTSTTQVPTYAGYGFLFVFAIWLLIVAWRRKEVVQAALG